MTQAPAAGRARPAPGLLRGRGAGDRDRRACAGALSAPRSTSVTRSSTTSTWWRRCSARARGSSTRSTRSLRAPSRCSARMASRRASSWRRASADLRVIDAACPLVTKVHKEGQRYAAQRLRRRADRPCRPSRGRGHHGSDQGPGPSDLQRSRTSPGSSRAIPSGWPSSPRRRSASTTRATSSRRCSAASRRSSGPTSGTSATPPRTARRRCARSLAQVDLILVVGAQNSSNSNRLREIGEAAGTPSYLIESAEALDLGWLDGVAHARHHRRRIGAGAAGPGPDPQARRALRRAARDARRHRGERAFPPAARSWPIRRARRADRRMM